MENLFPIILFILIIAWKSVEGLIKTYLQKQENKPEHEKSSLYKAISQIKEVLNQIQVEPPQQDKPQATLWEQLIGATQPQEVAVAKSIDPLSLPPLPPSKVENVVPAKKEMVIHKPVRKQRFSGLNELQKAVVWSEILDTPIGLRKEKMDKWY